MTTEVFTRISCDLHGWSVQVGPDRDTGQICEIVYSDGDTIREDSAITLPWDYAVALANAIFEMRPITPPSEA